MPARGAAQIVVAPLLDDSSLFRAQIKALVLKKITGALPAVPLDIGPWPSTISDNLADPTTIEPGPIDMLLGAHVWGLIAQQGLHNNDQNDLVGQQTRFGWLLFGGIAPAGSTFFGHVRIEETEPLPAKELNRWWELEAVPATSIESIEADQFRQGLVEECVRLDNGRYSVPIPMKRNIGVLGLSHLTAAQRFRQLERRFLREPEFHKKYAAFMSDYIAQGHARMLKKPMDVMQPHYFIPHHGIDNGKFRVVFDASAVTSSGLSCNDLQLTGVKLQQDLSDTFARFRTFKTALVADVRQMYRQIPVLQSYQPFQLILWRESPKDKLRSYALTTITYGMRHVSFRGRPCRISSGR